MDGAEATTTAFASGQGDIQQADLSTLNPTSLTAMGAAKPIMFYMFMTSIFTVAVPDESPYQVSPGTRRQGRRCELRAGSGDEPHQDY